MAIEIYAVLPCKRIECWLATNQVDYEKFKISFTNQTNSSEVHSSYDSIVSSVQLSLSYSTTEESDSLHRYSIN